MINEENKVVCKIIQEQKGLVLEIIHRDEPAMNYTIALANDEVELVHEATGKWMEDHRG